MYKLLIVDDDPIIRSSMARNIPFAAWGFSVSGVFEDGESAIAHLKQEKADVILTDVIMCEVSGIDLARWVRIYCPESLVIVLSGHQEFRFAQEAMRYGVRRYITKPVDLGELEEVFLRVRQELEERRLPDPAALPILYFGEGGITRVTACEEAIARAVTTANLRLLDAQTGAYLQLLNGAPTAVLLYCLSGLLVRIDEKIREAGISSAAILPQESLLKRLQAMQPDTLLQEAAVLLRDLCSGVQLSLGTGDSLVPQIKRYIREHLSEKITVEDLAHSVYLSGGYLSRAFRQQCGESLMDYVIRLRMQRAAELLTLGQYTVAEIAAMTGYQDRAYFHRSFKKFMGCTVRQYCAGSAGREDEQP